MNTQTVGHKNTMGSLKKQSQDGITIEVCNPSCKTFQAMTTILSYEENIKTIITNDNKNEHTIDHNIRVSVTEQGKTTIMLSHTALTFIYALAEKHNNLPF